MINLKKLTLYFSSIVIVLVSQTTVACTDFRIMAKDGTVIITRSMEFSEAFNSNVKSIPRGSSFNNVTTDGQNKPVKSWNNQYGYVYADGLNTPVVIDGINEKGLSFEFLYLPGETQYPKIPSGKNENALPYYMLGDWVLGNFSTIDQVKSALANIIVFEQKIKGMGDKIFPLHAAIFDKTGKSIVVEFINGEMKIHDNEMGILTNSPVYNWQITNLKNYVNLSPYNPKPVVANGLTFIATGQGAGMIGLPGDVSPPSRFVKTAILVKTATEVDNAQEAINLGQHIINNVDIPSGLVRVKGNGTDKELIETTQWVVFKDLSHGKFYYRTYDDMTLRMISLDEVDFSEKAPKLKIPMETSPYIKDITKEFLNSKDTA